MPFLLRPALLASMFALILAPSAESQEMGDARITFVVPLEITGDFEVFDDGISLFCGFTSELEDQILETEFLGGIEHTVVDARATPDRSQFTVELDTPVYPLGDLLAAELDGQLEWICMFMTDTLVASLPGEQDRTSAPFQTGGENAWRPVPPAMAGTCSIIRGTIESDGAMTVGSPECAG